MLRVWARNGARERQGTMKALAGKVLLKRSGVGGWHLELEGTTASARSFVPGWGVIVQEDDSFLFSGPATKIRREFSGGSALLVLEGETDAHLLRDRDIYPDPAAGSGAQTTVTHWVRTSIPAETIIADLINENVGSAALSSFRRAPDFPVVVSQGRGGTMSARLRWTKVLEEVQSIAAVSGLVVEVGQFDPGTRNVEARIRAARDLSRTVRFTPNKGLGDYWVEQTEPEATVVAVGGSGQGTARKVAGFSVNPEWGGRRREKFLDRRDTADNAELQRTAQEHGAETAAQAAAGFTIAETARYRFGRDFLLGDVISVYADDDRTVEVITAPVTSVDLEWDGHGRTVNLKVGENVAGTADIPVSLERARRLDRRLSRMEGGL